MAKTRYSLINDLYGTYLYTTLLSSMISLYCTCCQKNDSLLFWLNK